MNILICTVGTSLLMHWRDVISRYSDQERIALIANLKKLPDGDRKFGAEIGSIASLLGEGEISEGDKLCLCVSDTPEGKFVGETIKGYYGSRFAVEVRTVHGLQGKDPKQFQAGLRRLVETIAEIMRKHKGLRTAINATGGYKAQISFAGLIGQVFSVPVYYQFETFPTCIALPPLPVAWNFDRWLEHYDLLEDAEQGISNDFLRATDPRYRALPPDLRVLFSEEEGNLLLSALGALFHQGFKDRFPRHAEEILPPASKIPPERKTISYEDDNPGKHRGLQTFLEKIREVEYVTRINTFYYNPDLPERIRFYISKRGEDRIEGWFSDGKGTTKFDIFLPAGTRPQQRQAAVADLTEQFARG